MNENKIYLTAKELAGMLGVSESQAYKMIRKINLELEKKGFITVKGKRYNESRKGYQNGKVADSVSLYGLARQSEKINKAWI